MPKAQPEEPREIFPLVDLRHNDKLPSDPNMRDFRPRITKLDDVEEPTDVELAMLEEQIEVAAELGIEPDEVNAPLEVDEGEARRPKERSKPA